MRKLVLAWAILGAGVMSTAFRSADARTAPANLDTIEVPATYIVSPMRVTVAVPMSYLEEGDTATYPVVYLLNGHGGNWRNWPGIVPIDSIATEYRAIVVCPDGRNTWYWDSPLDSNYRMESFIIKELVPYIDANYRTRPSRENRAITGFSMGGHGGLWLGIRHSDVFGNAGSTSGGVDIMPWPNSWSMAMRLGPQDENREVWESHTVKNLVDSLQPGQLNIIFDCGTEDFFYEVNCNLDSALNARKIPHVYITGPGRHLGSYWCKSIYPQLEFFHDKFYPKH